MDETHRICEQIPPTTSIAEDLPPTTSIADDWSFFSLSMEDRMFDITTVHDEHPHPGSTVKMDVNEMENGGVYFSSFYVCFKGVNDGWLNGCRRVIGLDGCFLKSSGQLLSAIGRDANNHIFPLAWAVVSIENRENWKWFLNLVRGDIEMDDGLGLTVRNTHV